MLQITIPATEQWDEIKQEFVQTKEQTLCLEHSLVSLSKWESKWNKAFLTNKEKTFEETIDYIKCMTLTQNVDPNVYSCLTNENIKQINEYIAAPMTATYISDDNKGKSNREVVTSELIYYWMIALTIPVKFEKWHLNRLLTLIKVCNIKNQPPKKRGRRDMATHYSALNEARRKQRNTRG
jgi:hypothetical protein